MIKNIATALIHGGKQQDKENHAIFPPLQPPVLLYRKIYLNRVNFVIPVAVTQHAMLMKPY
ncbi:hypothetical protein LY16_03197 [Xenorhabdus doucetiae]|uniref:Uncharacterized protein n=1 Tax=Xenorhabdus doucetiae TaxID=351671 RepID=A0ABY3NN68_9GAMM|nr:hypothetical protein LY16_03197 [Xenorhabdus doucetiae]